MQLAVKIFITGRLRAEQYTVFQRNISLGVFNVYILFVCLYCYYKNITTNYWGWVVLALVSVCTLHCWTSICAAFHSHIFVHYRIWFKTVFLCTSVLCGVFLLPQCLCIVYLCCSAYQNHLSFFTFRILQCCLLHDQCFPQLVSFPAISFGVNGNMVKQEWQCK